ncbi:MAG: Uncharacterised protein [Prochlorococcus marinus str. MIT 9313]|nr:MAG: Uncharacterised protein [Prochlorococcus marinus str. MIT 9313]
MYCVKYCDGLLAYLDSELAVVALLHKCVCKFHANLQRIYFKVEVLEG